MSDDKTKDFIPENPRIYDDRGIHKRFRNLYVDDDCYLGSHLDHPANSLVGGCKIDTGEFITDEQD